MTDNNELQPSHVPPGSATNADEQANEAIRLAEKIMREDHDILRKLAKG